MNHPTIAVIGAGHMGSALIQGLLKNQYPKTALFACDHEKMHLDFLKAQWGIQTTIDSREAVSNAEVVIFAVKPQHMKEAVMELAPLLIHQACLILSVAAGIQTTTLRDWLGEPLPIVRAMPNTAALVGSGATALYANGRVNEEQHASAESILRTVGLTVWVDHEHQLDTVTALSGSGPAYFFYMMEAMAESAERLGLTAEMARLLTVQTALGAARLALEEPIPLDQLRAQVTSKGGTTEAAILTLEQALFKKIIDEAIQSAHRRSQELAESFK